MRFDAASAGRMARLVACLLVVSGCRGADDDHLYTLTGERRPQPRDMEPDAPPPSPTPCAPGDVRPCSTPCGVGVEVCDDSGEAYGQCDAPRPRTEVCNVEDDDCDGLVDEDQSIACCRDLDGDGAAEPEPDADRFDPAGGVEPRGRCNGCPAGVVVADGWACIPSDAPFDLGRREDEPVPDPGTDAPPRTVRFDGPFLIARFEARQASWRRLADALGADAAALGADPTPSELRGDDLPVMRVGWPLAVTFANALSQAEGRRPCYLTPAGRPYRRRDADAGVEVVPVGDCPGYRLPSEAEWEAAARAGERGPWPAGLMPPADDCDGDGFGLGAHAWCRCSGVDVPQPVGGLMPNAFGLWDALGNVEEWVEADGAPGEGALRGGSMATYADGCRYAARRDPGDEVGTVFGLRLVRTVPSRGAGEP